MPEQTQVADVDGTEPADVDLDKFASYEEGDSLVICDRQNPNAWVKSDTPTALNR